MEAEEINALLWECLASKGQPQTCDQLVRETGLSVSNAQVALARLRQANLVQVNTDGPGGKPTYQVILALDALRWAQAVGLGVSLLALEKHAHLSAAGKAEALRLTTDGSLEKVETDIRNEKIRQRDMAIRGRAASKAAATDLAQILRDTEQALKDVGKGKSPREEAIAMLLKQANSETQRALDGLVKTLQSK